MRSEPRLDMRNRHSSNETSEGSAQCARCVSLDDQQVRGRVKIREERARHSRHMGVRVFQSPALQAGGGISRKVEFSRIELGVLAGEDQPRSRTLRGKSVCHGSKFDRLGPGSDDQPYIRGLQSSPYLGEGNLPLLMFKRKECGPSVPSGSCRRRPGSSI